MKPPSPPTPLWRSPRGWLALALAMVAATRLIAWGWPESASSARTVCSLVVGETLFAVIFVSLARVRSLAWAGIRASVPSSIVASAILLFRLENTPVLIHVGVVLFAGLAGVIMFGPLHLVLYAPPVLAARRARSSPSLDAHDGVAIVAMLWAACVTALMTIPGRAVHPRALAFGLVEVCVALALALLAGRRRAQRRRWVAAVRGGDIVGYALEPADASLAGTDVPALTDADAGAIQAIDGLVVCAPSSAYRDDARPFARTSLAERPRVSLLAWLFFGVWRLEAVALVAIAVGIVVAGLVAR